MGNRRCLRKGARLALWSQPPLLASAKAARQRKSRRSGVDRHAAVPHLGRMTMKKLDLTGLRCPLPVLKTRKALRSLAAGDRLEVHCTDPLSVIDIPNLIRETGDRVEITEQAEKRIVFMIEKATAV
jgi:tRNA 2-thiouridine synthesizing protein A